MSSPPRRQPPRDRPPPSPPGRQTPAPRGPCRTGSPCSRRYGSRRSRTHGDTHECGPHTLGEPAAAALEPLHPNVEQGAPLGERASGPRRRGDFRGRGRTGTEGQLTAAHAEPERHASRADLRSRRPAPGVERAGAGARPRAPPPPAARLRGPTAPAPPRAQPRQATDPPNRTLRLGENSMPPPAMRGRSVSALVVSATVARSRLSARTQPVTLSPGRTPSNTLPDTPTPE